MKKVFFFLFIFILFSCENRQKSKQETIEKPYGNPASEGFNTTQSDQKAIAIADQIMEAMGGREAWDNTKILKWNFFGSRNLVWDKQNQNVEITKGEMKLFLDLKTKEGTAYFKDKKVNDADSLKRLLNKADRMWINDSYWLVMPFKLKDSGVTLKYIGEENLAIDSVTNISTNVLSLTFDSVGVTPQNKYYVYVSKMDSLVCGWKYFNNATDSLPQFFTPWSNYQKYGEILLSDVRGSENKLTDIAVLESYSF